MRFPKYHIATSVVNRILELDDRETLRAKAVAAAPSIPNTEQQGAVLDQALQTPPPAVPAPVGSQDAAILETTQGGSAADAIGSLAVLDSL